MNFSDGVVKKERFIRQKRQKSREFQMRSAMDTEQSLPPFSIPKKSVLSYYSSPS
jgi:hypothetical protein